MIAISPAANMDNRRQQIIKTALEYLGTPYHHQGRVKGAGVDCAGLIVCVARDLGLTVHDPDGYSRYADGVQLLAQFDRHCPVTNNPEPGDILIFRIRRFPSHCAILLEGDRIIHAHSTAGKVVAHALDPLWKIRLIAAYQFPQIPCISPSRSPSHSTGKNLDITSKISISTYPSPVQQRS